ncbi:MAG TPA: hypothetical protein VJ937_10735 [Salinivirga sp.]|uniref:hypothetical protein n=1 Tax=Salinivirga sp. TaxID=1970192 RepID=UPI002B474BA6|nr:hypothetical protein [Salinivirga sp.]HKK59945.1 hypothetical protein [Salinivirga sp.]
MHTITESDINLVYSLFSQIKTIEKADIEDMLVYLKRLNMKKTKKSWMSGKHKHA